MKTWHVNDSPLATTWQTINPADWENVQVPEREWVVQDFIPAATVSMLTGEGAAGKSTLALQLAAARASKRAWLSTMPRPGRTLVLSAEDDANELHRRLDRIRSHYGLTFADLADIRLVDLVGEDAILGSVDRAGIVKPSTVFNLLTYELEHFAPDLVIVDALADAFAGDENNRQQARQFVSMLKRPARKFACAFLCLAHPSITGINSGTGSSGSTAWGNSVRSRMFFEHAKATDGSTPDPDMRTLTVNKANYGPAGTSLMLKWEAGVYVVQTGPGSLDKQALENKADAKFLELLSLFDAQGRDVSAKRGPTYAPPIFASNPLAEGISRRHLEAAMERLLASAQVRSETSGPPSKRRSRLVLGNDTGTMMEAAE